MNELTAFEHALLEQFRILADRFDQSQHASEELSSKLVKWLRATSTRQEQIEDRLTEIEATQQRLSDALATQNGSTLNLAKQVNALLAELGS